MLKGLIYSDDSTADKSLYTVRDNNLNAYKKEAAIDAMEKSSRGGLITRQGQVIRGGYGMNESIAYHWMCALGYKYCKQHKYYYTDTHEREDELEKIIKQVCNDNCGLGANPSVFRKDETRNKLISLGQDKPKDDGSSVMISDVQSQEFGFGFSEFPKWKDT
eukprot:15364636-Ditylum_brightwellii.AAC.1